MCVGFIRVENAIDQLAAPMTPAPSPAPVSRKRTRAKAAAAVEDDAVAPARKKRNIGNGKKRPKLSDSNGLKPH